MPAKTILFIDSGRTRTQEMQTWAREADIELVVMQSVSAMLNQPVSSFPAAIVILLQWQQTLSPAELQQLKQQYHALILLVYPGKQLPLYLLMEEEEGIEVCLYADLRQWLECLGKNPCQSRFAAGKRVCFHHLALNCHTRQVWVKGKEVHLTPTEFRILKLLMQNQGKTVSYHTLLTSIWGYEDAMNLADLRVFITTLRKKIETDPAHPEYILTELKKGYRFGDKQKTTGES